MAVDYTEQLDRVKNKLSKLRLTDPQGVKSFGAKNHRYILGEPLSDMEVSQLEKNVGICLPEDFRAFVTTVGNGGPLPIPARRDTNRPLDFYGGGPYYGIQPLEFMLSDPSEEYKWVYQSPCMLLPDMSDEQWVTAYTEFNKKRLSLFPEDEQNELDEPYPGEHNFAGMIDIGTQGCTSGMLLVLNGPYQGKIVSADLGLSSGSVPHFTRDHNFLDWYERWLDEILAGVSYFIS